ncbi:hypothetical protein [Microbacterium foliorum]|uniref:hypothetical protein n=1 Tax=Microbacterium foliorum TaxID=104336 RepID=UPI001DEF6847|nr:hypothetical protein [Microbacterium foliorum]CAH0223944.1 hypothetical protein SRABI03_02539 [Microbacterium foliorum]CAH0241452.1 hypothetical protein SRABI44_02920 [Microbacterium foliorum]
MKKHRAVRALAVALAGLAVMSTASTAAADTSGNSADDSVVFSEVQADGSTDFTTDSGLNVTVVPSDESAGPEARDATARALQFSCNLTVNWPHGSHHVSGTINVVTRIQCDIPAKKLRLATSLIRISPNAQWHQVPVPIKENSAWIQGNAAAPCSAGPASFRGWGWGTITAPPGYQLAGSPDYDKYGDIKPVACGVARSAEGQSGVAERLTLTFVRSDLAE